MRILSSSYASLDIGMILHNHRYHTEGLNQPWFLLSVIFMIRELWKLHPRIGLRNQIEFRPIGFVSGPILLVLEIDRILPHTKAKLTP